jgi:hypothetical protein
MQSIGFQLPTFHTRPFRALCFSEQQVLSIPPLSSHHGSQHYRIRIDTYSLLVEIETREEDGRRRLAIGGMISWHKWPCLVIDHFVDNNS